MDINTPIGSKVIVTSRTKKAGSNVDKENINNLLEIGEEYELSSILVSGYHTDIWLKEFPEVVFNSVNFENVSGYESKGSHEMFKKIEG